MNYVPRSVRERVLAALADTRVVYLMTNPLLPFGLRLSYSPPTEILVAPASLVAPCARLLERAVP